jgi:transposase
VEERAREYNRLDKVLQGANIKLSSVAGAIDTKSGLAMRKAVSEGIADENMLAAMAKGTMKSKEEHLRQALKGLIQPHQRLILRSMLSHIDLLNDQIAELDKEIEQRLSEESDLIELPDEITGVRKQSAQVIVAEIGADMEQFPSAEHLASWAGLCPGNHESAGKNKGGRTRKGNSTLKKTVIQCGKAAGRSKNTYLKEMYRRIAARRGGNRAAVAVGHVILKICCYMIRDRSHYRDPGADYFHNLNKQGIVRRTVKRIESLRFKVTLEKLPAA